jgi:hypothetical protein
MLLPFADGHYNFWVYLCPFTAEFSARAANHALRTAARNDVMPWGQFQINEHPLTDQLIKASIKSLEERGLPSDLSKMLAQIEQTNVREQGKKQKFIEQGYRKLYADN